MYRKSKGNFMTLMSGTYPCYSPRQEISFFLQCGSVNIPPRTAWTFSMSQVYIAESTMAAMLMIFTVV